MVVMKDMVNGAPHLSYSPETQRQILRSKMFSYKFSSVTNSLLNLNYYEIEELVTIKAQPEAYKLFIYDTYRNHINIY